MIQEKRKKTIQQKTSTFRKHGEKGEKATVKQCLAFKKNEKHGSDQLPQCIKHSAPNKNQLPYHFTMSSPTP